MISFGSGHASDFGLATSRLRINGKHLGGGNDSTHTERTRKIPDKETKIKNEVPPGLSKKQGLDEPLNDVFYRKTKPQTDVDVYSFGHLKKSRNSSQALGQNPPLYITRSQGLSGLRGVPQTNVSIAATPQAPIYSDAGAVNSSSNLALDISSQGSLIASEGDVLVNVNASSSGYSNKIYYSTDDFKTRTYIGTDNEIATINIGSFEPGTEIQFGIDNGQGNFFKTGPAQYNPDQLVHAQVSQTDSGTVVAFEDLYGGGDNDFNDAIITVSTQAITTESTVAQAGDPEKNNRSGLGDGTNPGQGAGRNNAQNTGTLNPAASYDLFTSSEQDRIIDITV